MKRRLIQHGQSSLTVSIPKKFLNDKNLKKGDEIELEIDKDKIVIYSEKKPEKKKISIDISKAGNMIRKIVGAIYKTGYDEVEIKFNSFEELVEVQKLVREQFSGFEVINISSNNIIIKSISKIDTHEFDDALKRFFVVLNNISSQTANAIKNEDYSWIKKITLFKIESDKFADYLRRAINLGYTKDNKRIIPLYTIIEQLEKTCDRYKELCETIYKEKIKLNLEIKELSKDIESLLEEVYFCFYNFNLEEIIELGKTKEKIKNKINEIYNKIDNNKNNKNYIKVIIIFDKISNLLFDLNGPIMAVNLE